MVEVHDEWQVSERSYLSEVSMVKLAPTDNHGTDDKEVGNQGHEAARQLTSNRTDAEGRIGVLIPHHASGRGPIAAEAERGCNQTRQVPNTVDKGTARGFVVGFQTRWSNGCRKIFC